MPKMTIVTENQIKLKPGSGKIPGLESMNLSATPFVSYLNTRPNHYAPVHSHDEDEVMVVVTGRMIFNGVWCGVGSVIQVPANEEYWYATGDESCMVVLIRSAGRGTNTVGRQEPAFGAGQEVFQND
jgi:mannose-6-phosphate isomerase-like protein (cupin superfamily)